MFWFNVAIYDAPITVPFQIPDVIVPTEVNDDETTLVARVVPVIVLAATEPAEPVVL